VAGCTTSTGAESPTSLTTPLTTISSSGPSTTSSPPSPAVSGPSSGPSASPTTSSPPNTSKSTSKPTGPWPEDLKPTQVARAQKALAAYQSFYDVINKAFAKPQQGWDDEITRVTSEPIRSQILGELALRIKNHQHDVGQATVDPQVTKVGTGDVYIEACVDSSAVKTITKDGKTDKLPDVKGTYWRFKSKAQVTLFVDKTWRVVSVENDRSTKC